MKFFKWDKVLIKNIIKKNLVGKIYLFLEANLIQNDKGRGFWNVKFLIKIINTTV